MANLVSPGTTVNVTDNSVYSPNTSSTIPLFVLATRANKRSPYGNGIAKGTIKSNELTLVTSQRELLDTFGNPVFVKSSGESVHGHETNEYGLLAAHSFLGRGSRAYVIRADLDLGGLVPTKQEPVLPPKDNTFWMKNTAVRGGVFKYDGTKWEAVNFHVHTGTPNGGVDGDFGFDYSSLDGTLVFKDSGVWKPISDYANTVSAQPTAPANPSRDDVWYKTSQSAGGVFLSLSRYRAVDGVFVMTPVLRSVTPPTPNEGVVWENLANINVDGSRPMYIGTGRNFIPLNFVIQPNEPITNPSVGTTWFDDTITDFAMYVEGTDQQRGNEWVPVVTTTVSNPSSAQKVISGSAPTFPKDGAIWVDISTPENIDAYPVIKRWQGGQWVDISEDIVISANDPVASGVVNGTYWINTGASITRNTIKTYDPSFVGKTVVLNLANNKYEVVEENGNHWKPVSGENFGRRSIRDAVVESLQKSIVANEDIRAEGVYFQLIASPGYPELYDEMVALNNDINNVAFVIGDTPASCIPSGQPVGREVTYAEWASNANNVEATGERGFSSGKSPYSAFYGPWGMAPNVDGEDVMVPPSHVALRTILYSDDVSAPWFAPAGVQRGIIDNVSSVGYLTNEGEYRPVQLTKSQRDGMYENDINPFTQKPNYGLLVYGQKSFTGVNSALDRVNVARLIAKMRWDLALLGESLVFEINDAVLRRSATIMTERYLSGLARSRALYDYAVNCSEANNTPDRIDRNELYIEIAIKPSKVAEFVYFDLGIVSTDAPI